jgi:putative flavoprotein involved in K+ transport
MEMKTVAEQPENPAVDGEQYDVIVIGGGQAGLAMGYHLNQLDGARYIILDGSDQIGGAWANRWDSLTAFSPAAYMNLPGYPFPADDPLHLPRKDEVVAYLQEYAARFELPVRLNTVVTGLKRIKFSQSYQVETRNGETFTAAHVVVATGAYQEPNIPIFAMDLDRSIQQLHSSEYRNPSQVAEGDVLVVGAGASGAQISMELAEQTDRKVYLSGREVGSLPRKFLGKDIYWWLYTTRVLSATQKSFLGKRVKERIANKGDSLVGITEADIKAKAVIRVPKMTGVRGKLPVMADGHMPDVGTIIWCTGFRPNFDWIDGLKVDEQGDPVHYRGVVKGEQGLYFLGLPFLWLADSSLMNGVGADAKMLASAIRQRMSRSKPTAKTPQA